MNRITVTIWSIALMGCLAPTAIRAEAPTPRNGCLPREIAARPSVDPQTVTTIQGRVVGIEHNYKNQPIAAKEIATWVRVRTANGQQKLIYLGAARALKQQDLKVNVRDVVEIQGFQMPKAKQPTIVASSVKRGERVWKIANFTDKPVGGKLCRYTG
ncbi:hypothetical protein [Chamaesiphon sp. VAR_69_metabat_338]|uniref:hypothetical protein n=1 Tax=Chamaesiphon sp. VAR_69_metabat_338 TaxID=2964704 RepID=UPI00286E3E78|nr:hypothetical protein [Chamaesiphon sp. VAR_69_metabat_338]